MDNTPTIIVIVFLSLFVFTLAAYVFVNSDRQDNEIKTLMNRIETIKAKK